MRTTPHYLVYDKMNKTDIPSIKNFGKLESSESSKGKAFFYNPSVENGLFTPIRERLLTLCKAKGMNWFDCYKECGFHKSYASKILNGHLIPPLPHRIRIAQLLGVDSSAIWQEIPIQSADKLKEEPSPSKEKGEALIKEGEDGESV